MAESPDDLEGLRDEFSDCLGKRVPRLLLREFQISQRRELTYVSLTAPGRRGEIRAAIVACCREIDITCSGTHFNIETCSPEYFADADFLRRLDSISEGDVSGLVKNQIALLELYYREALQQYRTAFRFATAAGLIGMLFLVGGFVFALGAGWNPASVVTTIAGAFSEFTAGSIFLLASATRKQVDRFNEHLTWSQRLLFAENLCARLDSERRDVARLGLVETVRLALDTRSVPVLSQHDSSMPNGANALPIAVQHAVPGPTKT